jgi:hypothetical protein
VNTNIDYSKHGLQTGLSKVASSPNASSPWL